jgi:hypothetical protein
VARSYHGVGGRRSKVFRAESAPRASRLPQRTLAPGRSPGLKRRGLSAAICVGGQAAWRMAPMLTAAARGPTPAPRPSFAARQVRRSVHGRGRSVGQRGRPERRATPSEGFGFFFAPAFDEARRTTIGYSRLMFRRSAADVVPMAVAPRYDAPGARLAAAALAPSRGAHDRQRELVLASLIARPADAQDANRRAA